MNERLHLTAMNGAREEIAPDHDFPGRNALRLRITAAAESGDLVLLRSLQHEHRSRRLAALGGRTVHMPDGPSRRSGAPMARAVFRTPTSAESTAPSPKLRELVGWLCTWGEGLARDDRGEVIWLNVQPADLREWLNEVVPHLVPVRADHASAPVGRWHRFALSRYGLLATASIERSSVGDLLLDAADNGCGLSFAADISRCYKTHKVRNGLPVYAGGPIRILEGSVTPEPADKGCVITLVRGVRPTWMDRMDTLRRPDLP